MKFDIKNKQIIDERVPADKILWGGDALSVCYTLPTDNIKEGKKPAYTPYIDRKDTTIAFNNQLFGEKTNSIISVASIGNGGLLFQVENNSVELSEFGINLPFNFISKKNGGDWKNQFLFNSQYFDQEREILYLYLTKVNGANLVIATKGAVDGWKMDYSSQSLGHFFENIKLLKNFDKAYGTKKKENKLEFAIFPVNDFSDCLRKLSQFYDVPFLDYETNGGALGESIRLIPYGNVNKLRVKTCETETTIDFSKDFILKDLGETEIVPVYNEKAGGKITVYAYKDIVDLYKKSMLSVNLEKVGKTNGNLCEVQCWMSAMLRFLLKYSNTLKKDEKALLEGKLRRQFLKIMEKDENKAIPRLTILNKAYDNYPPYHIFKSVRIQEQFFGVTILLDAYKYFKEQEFFDYAINTMRCLIDNYQAEDGKLCRPKSGGGWHDYTTVCCPMIPIVDMANYLKDVDEKQSNYFLRSAEKMAEFIYTRGFLFPTETVVSDDFEAEVEEGSMSCSALALLYFCNNVKPVDKYINKAKEILDLHDAWIIQSPICQMKNSTLRWWETLWEGDADGPSICAGHAWTIWRAEADWLYYNLTGDREYYRKAKNGFMSNLSKIDEFGNSYSTYIPDMITGGGFADCSEQVNFRIAKNFADKQDSGLSRYVWIRINDTFLS